MLVVDGWLLSVAGVSVAAGGSVGAALLLLFPPHPPSIMVKDKPRVIASDSLRPGAFFIFSYIPL
ncbi:hypothetical protein D3C80_1947760 [compost metagenome]